MTVSSTPPEALIGQVLGGAYRILRRLDEGGMGTVFAAEHVRLKRPVAVKVMAAHLAEDESALARFSREAEIISQLHHPHVVQVLDFDTTEDGKPYLVMELLQGRSLDQVLARHRKLAIGAALRVAIQAASALSAAHSAGIVHRDLKPANIFLVDTGDQLFVKLLDFGISKRSHEEQVPGGRKLTGEFDILGTPDYMAPEQALGRTAAVDHRGDQYALGVILYEMLTGQVPFTADDVMELLQRVIRDSPVAPSALREELPRAVDGIVLRAMAKLPEERFSSIAEFAEALEIAAAENTLGVVPALGRSTDPLRADSNPVDPSARTSHITPQLPAQEPVTDTRRTSWHSKDPVKATQELIDRARQELGLDNLELAVSCAESAFEIAHLTSNPSVKQLLSKNATLLARIFERRLGGLRSTILVSAGAQSSPLTPEQAFLLSRLDGGLSIEEALDLSPMSRELTLGHLVSMMRTGHISLSA
ncbi:MAG TPA: serine/threonine-protein kinase [Polyangiaceae bacterium]|nr:serine/threonine-protein kinase [Polyangiaceae bacterium]